MELLVNKFNNLESVKKQQISYETTDILYDLVVATQIGFKYLNHKNNKEYFKNYIFCFHYCLEKYTYKNELHKNLNFNILSVNNQTGTYCFYEIVDEPIAIYKSLNLKKTPYIKLKIENATIKVDKIPFSVPTEKINNFQSISEFIHEDLKNSHHKALNDIKKLGFKYTKEQIELFTKELFAWIDIAKTDLTSSILHNDNKITFYTESKEYDYHVMNQKLSNKDKKFKNLKI